MVNNPSLQNPKWAVSIVTVELNQTQSEQPNIISMNKVEIWQICYRPIGINWLFRFGPNPSNNLTKLIEKEVPLCMFGV